VLPQINPEKRPLVNPQVFAVFEQWYRCPVAVCCFKKTEAAEAKPLAFAFEPTDPDRLVVYTLDGHDGEPPDPNARVKLDHTVFVGSYLTPKQYAATIEFADSIPHHLQPYLLDRAMGMPIFHYLINGDIVFDTAEVRQGCFSGVRSLPPFAPQRTRSEERISRLDNYVSGQRSRVQL
jgi:hypothetical protein